MNCAASLIITSKSEHSIFRSSKYEKCSLRGKRRRKILLCCVLPHSDIRKIFHMPNDKVTNCKHSMIYNFSAFITPKNYCIRIKNIPWNSPPNMHVDRAYLSIQLLNLSEATCFLLWRYLCKNRKASFVRCIFLGVKTWITLHAIMKNVNHLIFFLILPGSLSHQVAEPATFSAVEAHQQLHAPCETICHQTFSLQLPIWRMEMVILLFSLLVLRNVKLHLISKLNGMDHINEPLSKRRCKWINNNIWLFLFDISFLFLSASKIFPLNKTNKNNKNPHHSSWPPRILSIFFQWYSVEWTATKNLNTHVFLLFTHSQIITTFLYKKYTPKTQTKYCSH